MGRTTADPERIARYLAGQLSVSETLEFETLYPRQPDITRELEETARFREGLATLRERGELEALAQAQPWRRRWLLGIAASFAILAVGAALLVGRFHTVAPILGASPAALRASSSAALSISATYRFVTSRDAKNNALQITLPATSAALEFQVLPENRPEQATYSASLNAVPAAGAPTAFGVVGSIPADSEGFVRVFADSGRLPPGTYELIVRSEPAASAYPASRYRFVVRPPGNYIRR
jgi:energy-converting hydrogenase Eha subunit A